MNKSLRLYCLLLIVLLGSVEVAFSQTITTGPISASSICPGGTISVPFTTSITSGTFAAGNQFKVQLAPAVGSFVDIGSGTSSPLTGTIPPGTTGSGYRVRIISTSPVVNGSVSATTLSISTLAAPATTDVSYCQGATPATLTATAAAGATLKWWGTNATGGTSTSTAPPLTTTSAGETTYYVSQTVNGCESPRADIKVTVKARPAAPTSSAAPVYCQNETPTSLTATGQSLKWYSAPTGSNQISSTPVTSSVGTFKFYVSQTVDGCESERTEISVEVKATPPAPTVSPVSYCAGSPSSPLSAVAASGGTLKWYGLNGAVLAGPPTPPTTATGVSSYSVSQTVGASCESPKAVIQVTVNAIPSAPVATSAVAYCQNAPATPLTATGQNLKWYDVSSGGTSAASITPDTKTSGTKTYYVSQTVNGCEGPRTSVAVTVKALPSAPTVAQTTLSSCQGETVSSSLTATAGSGGVLVWGGPGVSNPATAPRPNSSEPGTFEYTVSQRVDGCLSEEVKITVTIKSKPVPPTTTDVAACLNTPVSNLEQKVTKVAGATLTWYTASTGGTALSGTPTPQTNSARTISYYVSQTVNGCVSERERLDVVINPLPAKPTITPAGPYCQGERATALNASGSGIQWYDSKGKINTAPIPSTDQAGSQYFLATQTVNGCEGPRDSIAVVIKPKPGKPTVTNSTIEFCQNTQAPRLTATFEPNSTQIWTGPTSATAATAPTIPNNLARSYAYTVSQTVEGCTSDKTEINVTVNRTPDAPAVTISRLVVCQKETPITLTANGEGLKWYSKDSTTVVQNTVQNTDQDGTFVYYVSQTVKACESPKSKTELRVKPLPAAPQITSKTEICQDAPAETLTASGQSLKWFGQNDQQLGEAPKPSTNVEQETTYTYKTTQTVEGCESDKLTVTYKVNVTPTPTVVTPVVYCQNATARPLEATGQNLKWINPYGGETSTAPTPPTTNISTKPEGDSYFVTQKAGNGCESRRSEIRLIVNAPPTAKIEGNASVNLGRTVPVTITFTSVPPFSYTLSDGTTGTSASNQQEINLLPTKKTTIYTVTHVSNSCGAGTPVGTFTVNAAVPTVSTSPLSVTTICVGTPIQVPFTTAGEFTQGNSFRVEIAPVADTAFTNKIEVVAGAMQSPITAPIPTTVAQGLYRVRVTATNPQVPVPGSSSSTILNIRALPTVTLTGSKDIYDNEGAPLSFAFTGDGPWTFEYLDSLKTTRLTTSTNPHIVTVTPVRSTTYSAASVSNTCGVGTATGTAIIRVLPVLGLEPDPLLTAVKVFPVPAEHTLTIDIDLPLQKEPARLKLTDQNGRVTQQLTTRQRTTQLDVRHQAAGYYFLQIQIGNRTTVRKILKR